MKENLADDCPLYFDPKDDLRQADSGSRMDGTGKSTYNIQGRDQGTGVQFEKVFDQDHRLIRIQKRARGNTSETHFDTTTGAVTRISESSMLPDGNSMTKDIIYGASDRSTESVVVIAPNGDIVRKVERRLSGARSIFQGQTEFSAGGVPSTTVNHHLDEDTGHLMRREQIQWHDSHNRSLTEAFYFCTSGELTKYCKVIYHAGAGPFLDETLEYDVDTKSVSKRELSAFALDGHQTSQDTLTYGIGGEILERKTIFFDRKGNAVATRICSA